MIIFAIEINIVATATRPYGSGPRIRARTILIKKEVPLRIINPNKFQLNDDVTDLKNNLNSFLLPLN